MPDDESVTGRIFDLARCAVHDGPGLRTTVFLKGCPLSCRWCHNPEGMAPEPELAYRPESCLGCGACAETCLQGCHGLDADGRHVLDRADCTACGACAAACPADALELVGREASVAEVMAEVLADRAFYAASGGGLTLSGGEPLAQPSFCAALLVAARGAGVHRCVETSCQWDWEAVADLVPLVDVFLCDWKESDPERHRSCCGVDNRRIRENLRRLHAAGAGLRLRCPIVPGFNDRPDHFDGIAALARDLPGLEEIELLPYHHLAAGKRAAFGMEPARDLPACEPSAEAVASWREHLRGLGVAVRTGVPA